MKNVFFIDIVLAIHELFNMVPVVTQNSMNKIRYGQYCDCRRPALMTDFRRNTAIRYHSVKKFPQRNRSGKKWFGGP